ncbi:hypothetical protein HDU96_007072, partial [Phlyctochytrium bullatum]
MVLLEHASGSAGDVSPSPSPAAAAAAAASSETAAATSSDKQPPQSTATTTTTTTTTPQQQQHPAFFADMAKEAIANTTAFLTSTLPLLWKDLAGYLAQPSISPQTLQFLLPILVAILAGFSSTFTVLLFAWLTLFLLFKILLATTSSDPTHLRSQRVKIALPQGPFAVPLTCYSRDCVLGSSPFPCYSPTCWRRKELVAGGVAKAEVVEGESAPLAIKVSPTTTSGHLLASRTLLQAFHATRRAAIAATTGDVDRGRIPRPPLRRRMSFMSQGFAKGIFSRAHPTTNVFGVIYLEALPSLPDLHARLVQRLLADFPRFRSIATVHPANPNAAVWTVLDAQQIDVARLLVHAEMESPEDVEKHVEQHMHRFWDPALPVWRLHVLRSRSPERVASALVLEVHHGIGDGLSLVRVALAAVTDAAGGPFPPIEYRKPHPKIPGGLVGKARWVAEMVGRFAAALWVIVLNALWVADTETAVK